MPDTAVVFGPLNGSCRTAVVMSLGPMLSICGQMVPYVPNEWEWLGTRLYDS